MPDTSLQTFRRYRLVNSCVINALNKPVSLHPVKRTIEKYLKLAQRKTAVVLRRQPNSYFSS